MKQKNKKRCALSGRIINSNEEVIKTKYAEEYLKKRGYKVISPQMIALIMTLTLMFILIGGTLVLSSPVYSAYEIQGNSVIEEDNNVYFEVTPHTSNTPNIKFISKQFSGEIDFIVGFNNDYVEPYFAGVPYQEDIQKSYTCDYQYTTTSNEFTCYKENENGTQVLKSRSYETQDNNIFYWTETRTSYNEISGDFINVQREFQGFNEWYIKQGINVNAGQEYNLQVRFRPKNKPFIDRNYKYFFGVKPSSETLQEAINNGHFYYIDPWTADLNTNLQAYYKLDETTGDVIDSLGLYNGTNNGATRGVTGIINNAFDFEKSSSQGVENTLNLNGNNDFTISVWINMESSTEYMSIVSTDISNTDPRGFQFQIGANNELRLVDGNSISLETATGILSDSTWHHIVLINDAGTGYIYVDNDLKDSGSVNFNDVSNDLSIGMRGTAYEEFFDGKIDEVGIWNRALSQSEVEQLYNNGNGITYTEEFTTIEFINQTPLDLNSTNLLDNQFFNYTYNITGSDLNQSTIKTYYKVNSTSSDISYFINGTSYTGWFSKLFDNNVSSIYEFIIPEWEVYPITHNINKGILTDTSKDYYSISNNEKGFIKTRIFNISAREDHIYNYLEVNAEAVTGSGSLGIWYCNSSYTGGTEPVNSNYCSKFYDLNASKPYDYTENLSSYHIIPWTYNQTTLKLNEVKITNTSYFLLQGAKNTNWRIYTIPQVTRTDQIQTSTDGKTYTNYAGTTDFNLRSFNNHSFYYYACVNTTTGTETCSNTRIESFEKEPLPPTGLDFFSPLAEQVLNGVILINYSNALSPQGSEIINYNISLVDEKEDLITFIHDNNQNLTYLWNSTIVSDGDYKIRVTACDNESLCSDFYSELFSIDNVANEPPNITLNSPEDDAVIDTDEVELKFTITDKESDLLTYYVYLNDEVICSDEELNGTENICEYNNLVNNTNYSWYVEVIDPLGENTTSETRNFYVSFPKPQFIFYINFDKDINRLAIILALCIALFFFIIGYSIYSGFIIFVTGFILLFNGINIPISLLIIFTGFIVMFMPERSET